MAESDVQQGCPCTRTNSAQYHLPLDQLKLTDQLVLLRVVGLRGLTLNQRVVLWACVRVSLPGRPVPGFQKQR